MREFLITAESLQASIKTLQPFVSKEETRYYLTGIFFEWCERDEHINMVATDGHKLCVLKVEVDLAEDSSGPITAIVPNSALRTILQMLKGVKPDWPVAVKFDDNNQTVWIDCPEQKAELKCIDGTFPDYRRVIPAGTPNFTIGLQKAQATEAMRAVSKHSSKEPMEWQRIDASSPLKLVGENKIVIVMPTKTAFDEIDLSTAA